MIRLIGFTGPAGSGKTTAAMHLVAAHNFRRAPFAGTLKRMLVALGLSREDVEGERKRLPNDLLGGRTPRYAMQTLGTEWGRELIDRDLWVRAWRRRVALLGPDARVVADDVRFPNEVEAIRDLGGVVIRIVRPDAPARLEHASETTPLPAPDHVIENTGSLADLRHALDALLSRIS